VDTSKKALYQVVYEVEDLDGNKTTAGGVVSVGIYISGGYAVDAHSFVRRLTDVPTNAALLDADALGASASLAWDVSAGFAAPTPAAVRSLGGYSAAVGEYGLIVGVANGLPTPALPITGKVVPLDVLSESTTPGGIGQDARYYIGGNNIALRPSQAQALAAAGDQGILAAVSAGAWKVSDDLASLLSKNACVVSDGGFVAANAAKGTNGLYTVTLGVAEEPGIQAKVTINVVSGTPPVIDVVGMLEYTWTPTSNILVRNDLMTGVTADDPGEDGDITDQVVYEIYDVLAQTTVASIDTNIPGVYQVTYNVQDADGDHAIPKDRTVIVNDGRYLVDMSDDFVIGAKDYVIRKGDVTGTDTEILSRSFAEAYDANGHPLTPLVKDKGIYAAGVPAGDYPVILHVPGFVTEKAITITVTDHQVVDPPEQGKHYAIDGNNFRINLTEANAIISVAQLMSEILIRSDASVTKLIETLPNSNAVVAALGGMGGDIGAFAEGAKYTIRLAVDFERSTYIDIEVLVSDGNPPVLNVDTPIMLSVGAIYDSLAGVSVSDIEDGQKGIDLMPSVTYHAISGGSTVDTTTAGAYLIEYSVTDNDYNTVTARRAVLIGDWSWYPGSEYALYTGKLAANVMTLTGDSKEVIARSGTYAVKLNDFTPTPVSIKDTGGYKRAAGDYNLMVEVGADPNVWGIIQAKITANTYVVTFDANGGHLTGPRTISVTQPNTRIAYMPSQPDRSGYTFLSWNTAAYGYGSGAATFTPYTDVVNNITVYAQWDAIPAQPQQPPVVVMPPTRVIVPPPVEATVLPEIVTVPGIVTQPQHVGDIDPPISSAEKEEPGWALINLLCALIAIGIMLAMTCSYFAGKRSRSQVYHEQRRDLHDLIITMISIVAGVASCLILLLTQNFSKPMQTMDDYTVIMALIVLVQIISPFIKSLKKDDPKFSE
jgi:uncharacterized repeat protein (TIGR02543 family)